MRSAIAMMIVMMLVLSGCAIGFTTKKGGSASYVVGDAQWTNCPTVAEDSENQPTPTLYACQTTTGGNLGKAMGGVLKAAVTSIPNAILQLLGRALPGV